MKTYYMLHYICLYLFSMSCCLHLIVPPTLAVNKMYLTENMFIFVLLCWTSLGYLCTSFFLLLSRTAKELSLLKSVTFLPQFLCLPAGKFCWWLLGMDPARLTVSRNERMDQIAQVIHQLFVSEINPFSSKRNYVRLLFVVLMSVFYLFGPSSHTHTGTSRDATANRSTVIDYISQ